MILIDSHTSELANSASVVLPARTYLEKIGTFTNHARRVQRIAPIVEPNFEAWSEGDVLTQSAYAANLDGWPDSWDVFGISKQLSEVIAPFAGIHLGTLDPGGSELA